MIQPAEVQYLHPAQPNQPSVRLTVCLVVGLLANQPPTTRPGARLLDLCPLSRWVFWGHRLGSFARNVQPCRTGPCTIAQSSILQPAAVAQCNDGNVPCCTCRGTCSKVQCEFTLMSCIRMQTRVDHRLSEILDQLWLGYALDT
jgi:hypothetical protein